MFGLKFQIPNEYGNYINQIFHALDFNEYKWNIRTDDIINDQEMNGIFTKRYMDGETFSSSINEKNYYMIFVDIKAFGIDGCYRDIETFNDFVESDCQIILLCTDSTFISFYCKKKEIMELVHNSCLANSFKNLEILSKDKLYKESMIAF